MRIVRILFIALIGFLIPGVSTAQQASVADSKTAQISSADLEQAVAKGIVLATAAQRQEPTLGSYWRSLWQNSVFIAFPIGLAFYFANRFAQAHGPLRIRFRRRSDERITSEDLRQTVAREVNRALAENSKPHINVSGGGAGGTTGGGFRERTFSTGGD
jgi:hypothetical protein